MAEATIIEQARAASDHDAESLLEEILAASASDEREAERAAELHHAFLLLLKSNPQLLQRVDAAEFLAQTVQPTDFDQLQWESPEDMLRFCEALYGFRFPTAEMTEQVRSHIRTLLQQALRHYEAEQEWEKLFLLFRIAPSSPMMDDIELSRLRHLAHSYELRRITRNRRWLYSYLILQIALVFVVFPFLFINAENGEIQRQVEKLTDVEVGDEGYRLFSYADGLYWSVITAASIGYGDITPYTNTGRIIAGVLGTMGVITVGVIAGLVLKWITPRSLD